CKLKTQGGTTVYAGSALERLLPASGFERLLQARSELGRLKGLPPGPDLGRPVADEPVHYLPAHERYAGIVYREGRVRELYPRAHGKKVLVVSALYGVLDADDPIRCYQAQMGEQVPGNGSLKTWWKHRCLGDLVDECILALRPQSVHDLLSTSYREVLAPWPRASLEQAGITYTPYTYRRRGSGSQWDRGDQIRKLLLDAGEEPRREPGSP
ncbi:unnamed protein product, partial [marine sediment metagenome]